MILLPQSIATPEVIAAAQKLCPGHSVALIDGPMQVTVNPDEVSKLIKAFLDRYVASSQYAQASADLLKMVCVVGEQATTLAIQGPIEELNNK